ncbi:MAG: 4-vinyl reductase [Aggregatilineales bacterium]
MADQSAIISAHPSGSAFANRIARYFFLGLEEVMGTHGLLSTLEVAGLAQYYTALPPDNLARSVDFSVFSALNLALDEMYGPRGGRGMALRAGRAWLVKGLNNFGVMAGINDPAFRALPWEERVRLGLRALSLVFTHFSDQHVRLEDSPQVFRFIIERSAMAWARRAERPVCHPFVGLLQETCRWASNGRDLAVRETECSAAGAAACLFVINKTPLS